MKKILLTLFVFSAFSFLTAEAQVIRDTAFMQANQTNDVYYSLENGTTANVSMNNWDIAFFTNAYSDGIAINDGNGAVLYSYPNGDSSAWATLDTAGLYAWTKMFNTDTNWEAGAFNRFATGHPDYGWGVYNITTHAITGDSIFVIKLVDGSFKKLRILKKDAVGNKYLIRWANLDGSGLTNATIDCSPYTSKLFIGYSFASNSVVDREPAKNNWDLKFTKYMFPGYGPIQGVLTNKPVKVAKHFPKDTAFANYALSVFDTAHINIIGYSWKSMGLVKDSLLYFVKDVEGNIYKFVFESYSTPTGKIGFRKVKLLDVGGIQNDKNPLTTSVVYPNPAESTVHLIIDLESNTNISVNIMDVTGKLVLSQKMGVVPQGLQQMTFDIESLQNGIYMMSIQSENAQKTIKFIINK